MKEDMWAAMFLSELLMSVYLAGIDESAFSAHFSGSAVSKTPFDILGWFACDILAPMVLVQYELMAYVLHLLVLNEFLR